MKNKNIQILMVDRNYLNKIMGDLPGLAGVSEDEEVAGVPGTEKVVEPDDEESFKQGYLKGYEQGLIDAMKQDKE